MHNQSTDLKHVLQPVLRYLEETRNYYPVAEQLPLIREVLDQRSAKKNLSGVDQYVDRLEVEPDELRDFLCDITDQKKHFYQDESFWHYLTTEIKDWAQNSETRQFRCWTIDCGTGQETYSLVMSICEALGNSRFQDSVKIFATDRNEADLQFARQAVYDAKQTEHLPPHLLDRYFVRSGESYQFRNDLRRSVIFGKHSVINDPAISRMDLIICRNVMVFFDQDLQRRLISRLSFALNENGHLIVGKGEHLATTEFICVERANRVFRIRQQAISPPPGMAESTTEEERLFRFEEKAYDSSPVAQLTVDANGLLAAANARARAIFGLVKQDIGRPFQDLEVSYRPVELRSLMDTAAKENNVVTAYRTIRHNASGRPQLFDVYIQPLSNEMTMGMSIQFDDVTELYELQDELVSVNQQLQTANEELQSAHEELETTNEELQSTNEELATTNEELQSTNEELETMNEELQSTNAELEHAIGEQRKLANSVETTNSFLQSILSSMSSGVIVLNDKLEILIWNDHCRDLWGLRLDEVQGHHFGSLDIGLPVASLKTPLNTFIQLKKDFDELVVTATNRRGRKIICSLRITPLLDSKLSGIILLIDDQPAPDQ